MSTPNKHILQFETLAHLALKEDGKTIDQRKAKDIVKLFRPDRQGKQPSQPSTFIYLCWRYFLSLLLTSTHSVITLPYLEGNLTMMDFGKSVYWDHPCSARLSCCLALLLEQSN